MNIKNDTYEEFISYLNKFIERNGGYCPNNIDKWFYQVDKNHKDVREVLGGNSIQKFYKLTAVENPIDVKSGDGGQIINEIEKLFPRIYEYLRKEDRSIFEYSTLAENNHNAIKVSKLIMKFAPRYFAEHFGTVQCIANTKELEKLLSKLGEVWAKNRTNDCELEVTLSTNHKGFLLLGHYGVDDNSCFRQKSSSPKDKFILAQSPETFVISVSKEDKRTGKHINVARAFGWYNKTTETFNLRNYYFRNGFQEGDFLELCKKLFSDLLGEKCIQQEDITKITNSEYSAWHFYQNNYGNWSFSKKEVGTQVCSLNYNGILCFRCPRCQSDFKSDSAFQNIDDDSYCPYCAKQANVCELTKTKTFKNLVEILDPSNRFVFVLEIIAKEYSSCDICNIISANLEHIKNSNVCTNCLETNFTTCDICKTNIIDDQIEDFGDNSVCTECVAEHGINFGLNETEIYIESIHG